MQLARILLPIQQRADMEAIGQTAFALAERFGAELEGLHAYPAPHEEIFVYYEAGGPSYYEALIEAAAQRNEAAEKRASQLFGKLAQSRSGVASRYLTREGHVVATIAQRGRLADLTVIGTAGGDGGAQWTGERDAAIFQTGRPVILAPATPATPDAGKTVVIAWNDSVEAARAIAAARPFIAGAEAVHVVSAGDDAVSRENLEEVQNYLARLAGNVTTAIIGETKSNPGALLLEEAGKYPDALLVMGAYSHWRWQEWVFGGVSEHVLNNAAMPVLMAH